jgi:AAHS family 4-hydroxybenzoate transporter-like MFS transporter
MSSPHKSRCHLRLRNSNRNNARLREDQVTASNHESVDLVRLIDQLDVGRFHIRLVALCAAVVFMDGFDAQAMGYIAPSLSQAWKLAPGALGPVFGIGLLGIMIGALIGGPLADYIGRKKLILSAALFFGACSLVTALVADVPQLMIIRLVTGLGLGAAMPNAIALVSEYSPRRRRAIIVMIMFCGFSLGAALGGVVAGLLIPLFGWKSVFIFGGVAPLLFAPILVAALPESVRFLVLNDPRHPDIASILSRMGSGLQLDARVSLVVNEEKRERFTVPQLFGKGRALATVLLWIIFFMSLLDLYLLSNWLPTVIHGLGMSVSTAAFTSALFQIGGTISPFLLGWLIDRYGFFRVLFVTYLLAAIVIAVVGSVGPNLGLLMLTVFAAGFCVVGGQSGANALAASLYPTTVRSTGVGWALGIGRIGSIVGPVVGGLVLAQNWGPSRLFLVGAVPSLCAAAAAAAMWMTQLEHKPDH